MFVSSTAAAGSNATIVEGPSIAAFLDPSATPDPEVFNPAPAPGPSARADPRDDPQLQLAISGQIPLVFALPPQGNGLATGITYFDSLGVQYGTGLPPADAPSSYDFLTYVDNSPAALAALSPMTDLPVLAPVPAAQVCSVYFHCNAKASVCSRSTLATQNSAHGSLYLQKSGRKEIGLGIVPISF